MRKPFMLILLTLVVFACDAEAPVTTETTTTAPPVELTTTTVPLIGPGSPEQPIKVLFPPDPNPDVVLARTASFVEELSRATGLSFEAVVPTSYANSLDLLCRPGGDTFALLTAEAYALANQRCQATIVFRAVIGDAESYRTAFFYRRDDENDIKAVADLAGKKWAHPGETSPAGFVLPKAILAELEIELEETQELANEAAVIRAVYDKVADFGTATFVLNTNLEGVSNWNGTVAAADVPKRLWPACEVDESSRLVCGEEVVVLDARSGIATSKDDVITKIGVLFISDPILFGGIVFSGDWPEDTRSEVQTALSGFIGTGGEPFATQFGPYGWQQLVATDDTAYEPVRKMVTALGLAAADLG